MTLAKHSHGNCGITTPVGAGKLVHLGFHESVLDNGTPHCCQGHRLHERFQRTSRLLRLLLHPTRSILTGNAENFTCTSLSEVIAYQLYKATYLPDPTKKRTPPGIATLRPRRKGEINY